MNNSCRINKRRSNQLNTSIYVPRSPIFPRKTVHVDISTGFERQICTWFIQDSMRASQTVLDRVVALFLQVRLLSMLLEDCQQKILCFIDEIQNGESVDYTRCQSRVWQILPYLQKEFFESIILQLQAL